MKKRRGLEGLQQDAEKRNKEFDKKVKQLSVLNDHNQFIIYNKLEMEYDDSAGTSEGKNNSTSIYAHYH